MRYCVVMVCIFLLVVPFLDIASYNRANKDRAKLFCRHTYKYRVEIELKVSFDQINLLPVIEQQETADSSRQLVLMMLYYTVAELGTMVRCIVMLHQ